MSVPPELLTEERINRFMQEVLGPGGVHAEWALADLARCQTLDEQRAVINDCLGGARYHDIKQLMGSDLSHRVDVPTWEIWKARVNAWRAKEQLG